MTLRLILFPLFIIFFSKPLFSEEKKKVINLNDVNSMKVDMNTIKTHIVQEGDTLSSIAKKYSINKELIIKANKLIDENYIFVGQNLKIRRELLPEIENDNFSKNFYHEVNQGENLTEIANKYQLNLNQLIEINNIKNPNLIEVGTKLRLKKEIIIENTPLVNQPKDQRDEASTFFNKKYGPLIIKSEKSFLKKRRKLLEVEHKNGQLLILSLKCDKRQINVRGLGRQWKGWMPAKTRFEENLLNDLC